jgi:hypothetical protein
MISTKCKQNPNLTDSTAGIKVGSTPAVAIAARNVYNRRNARPDFEKREVTHRKNQRNIAAQSRKRLFREEK